MELNTTVFDQLVSKVASDKTDQSDLQLLCFISDSPETTQRFVEALLTQKSSASDAPETIVSKTMTILEAIADKSNPIACVLMAHLWPFASALRMHDICDSIDIWVSHCNLPKVRRHLLMLASSEPDDGIRRHYEQMAK